MWILGIRKVHIRLGTKKSNCKAVEGKVKEKDTWKCKSFHFISFRFMEIQLCHRISFYSVLFHSILIEMNWDPWEEMMWPWGATRWRLEFAMQNMQNPLEVCQIWEVDCSCSQNDVFPWKTSLALQLRATFRFGHPSNVFWWFSGNISERG